MSWTDTLGKKEPEAKSGALRNRNAPNQCAPKSERTGAHAKYLAAVLNGECEAVRNEPKGSRNTRLNIAAFNVATCFHLGLGERDAHGRLREAALEAGLTESETEKTIASGFAGGKKNPREIPEPKNGSNVRNSLQEPPPDDGFEHTDAHAPDAEPSLTSVRDAHTDTGNGDEPRNDGATSVAAGIVWHDAKAIFAPLPPTNWLARDLQICPGRPTLWCGYGYVGKSITAQTMALSMAGGVPVFGKFDIRRGLVRHFDHEQGKHATFKRYQRATIGMELESAELDGRLFVTVFPSVYLNMAGAVDVYSRICDGTDFVIIDALRGATPGEDENDSKIRVCLDNLSQVSEKVGTTFLVIHHSGKPQENHSDQRTKARGSSAIFDACGPVFILSGSKETPHKLVSQQKAPAEAEGSAIDDFYLTVEDVARDFNPKAGVRVTYRSKEDVFGVETTDAGRAAEHDAKVLEIITSKPGVGKNQLRTLARPLRNPDIDDAVIRLELAKKIETKPGPNRSSLHFPKEAT